MSSLEDLIAQLPIADIAAKLGVDSSTAQAAVQVALPAILGGLQANAEQGGASSLTKAVTEHGPALVDGGVSLADVNSSDGEKIVTHVFGEKKKDVIAALGTVQPVASAAAKPVGADLVGKLLPMLAPIAMSMIAQQLQPKPAAASASTTAANPIGTVLGNLLGNQSGSGSSNPLGAILGGLGGLLGGGTKN